MDEVGCTITIGSEIVDDGTETNRVTATCSICGHEASYCGPSDDSMDRCMDLMNGECPEGESNLYFPVPKMSSLCQAVTREGKTIRVEIYDDFRGRWILEVYDEYENSLLWDYRFETEQDALDELLRRIDEEGINSVIGPKPVSIKPVSNVVYLKPEFEK